MKDDAESTNLINYDSPTALRAFLAERGLWTLKRFGQNFLINRQIRQRLVSALEAEETATVWEVGSGLGAMTGLLLNGRRKVVGFEIDRAYNRILASLFPEDSGFVLVDGDVRKTWPTAAKAHPARYGLGNLPYNIAASLLAGFIEAGQVFDRLVVTVQKEMSDRMIAQAGDEAYSSFSVVCASAYNCRRLMILKPAQFFPEPKVDSAAVLLERLPTASRPTASFYPLVRALFAARRKTLRNNLEAFLAARSALTDKALRRKWTGALASALLAEAAIDPLARAETLGLDKFISLSAAVDAMELA